MHRFSEGPLFRSVTHHHRDGHTTYVHSNDLRQADRDRLSVGMTTFANDGKVESTTLYLTTEQALELQRTLTSHLTTKV